MSVAIIVGESNPYGYDPKFALYPSPEGSAGYRLCVKVLGMQRTKYLNCFDRVNLCVGKWSMPAARDYAVGLLGRTPRPIILLGSKVSGAFGVPFKPFDKCERSQPMLVLPHPSGLNRMWNESGIIDRARQAVKEFVPEIAHMIGVDN